MNEQLIQRIKQCPTLPTLPAVAVQVLELAQNPDVDIAQIAKILSKDPALSLKILRTVNSSFYARSNPVSTISHALVFLGLQSVKTLVLGFSLPHQLLADTEKEVCRLYDVIREKIVDGHPKEFLQRSTFIIDKKGVVRHIMSDVNPKEHVEEVLKVCRQLLNGHAN